jgi:hypothetical protein
LTFLANMRLKNPQRVSDSSIRCHPASVSRRRCQR